MLLEEFDETALCGDTVFYKLEKMGYLMLCDKCWERKAQFLDYFC